MQFGQIPFNPVQEGLLSRITDAQAKLYAALCSFNRGTGPVNPSIRTLVKITGLNKATVIRGVAALAAVGAISISKGGGENHPNEYSILDGRTAATVLGEDGCANATIRRSQQRLKTVAPAPQDGRTSVALYKEEENKKRDEKREPALFNPTDEGNGDTASATVAPFRQFTDYFCDRVAAVDGMRPTFGKREGVAAAAIFRALGEDIQVAKAVTDEYLADSSDFFSGHSITKLQASANLDRFRAKALKGKNRNGHGSPIHSTRKGEYPADPSATLRPF